MNESPKSPAAPAGRLLSLDAFRGAAMMSMVLVNNPGSWDHVYPPLLHADWHGCTFTDLIFPFFLFIVGTSMAFSFAKRLRPGGDRKPLAFQIVRRTAIILGLGMFLNALLLISFPDSPLRIPGVLQRIALCYFFVGWMALYMNAAGQWAVTAALMAVYASGMFLGGGGFDADNNFCLALDRIVLQGHVWPLSPADGFDPEGVWSTLTAIVTTFLGYRAGCLLRSGMEERDKLTGLFLRANGCLLAAYATLAVMPVNKQLWTVPYVFLTAGLALHALAVSYYFIDVRKRRRFIAPMLVYGSNAIFIYVGSGIAAGVLSWIRVGEGEAATSLWGWMYDNIFRSIASPVNASLLMGLAYALLWLGIASILYRKRIFIKV